MEVDGHDGSETTLFFVKNLHLFDHGIYGKRDLFPPQEYTETTKKSSPYD
jgi:hypothetical protein